MGGNWKRKCWRMGVKNSMGNDPVAIRLDSLSKVFGRRKKQVRAVHDLNLEVKAGQVYGFLGPNGAGKSTTIRMIMDLVRPSQGSVHLFGQNVHTHHRVLQKVGALVEGALFYPFLTGRKNLAVLARTSDVYDQKQIELLLAQVKLTEQADRPVKGYSTGMKQRLGLAAALLNDPDLVILDEPTNGLDPAGIQEMRGFIRELVDERHKTVFLSSHMLGEVEQVCDRVAIIHHGRILQEGAVADLLAARNQLRIEAAPLDRAEALLSGEWAVTVNGRWLELTANREEAPRIVQRLVANDVAVYQMKTQRQSLEAFFLEVTQAVEATDG